MGQRAIYTIVEQGESSHFYAHWGANNLSPMFRLKQAEEIQAQINQPITHIIEHLSRNGGYENPPLDRADMFCHGIGFDESEPRKGSGIELFVTINLDTEQYTLDYNEHYWSLGKYEIPIQVGMDNLQATLDYAQESEISDFYEMLDYYDFNTGMSIVMEESQVNRELDDLLQSSEADEMKQNYRRLLEEEKEDEAGMEV